MSAVVQVTLSMGMPIALPKNGALTGDALLFAAKTRIEYPNAEERTPDVWEPIELPVVSYTSEQGRFYGVSALLTDAPYRTTIDTMYKRGFDRTSATGELRAASFTFRVASIPSVYFFAEIEKQHIGEFQKLVRKLNELYVGIKGTRGYGVIHQVTARIVERSSAIANGELALRPLPIEFASTHRIKGIQDAHGLEPPYFAQAPSLCIIQSFDPIWRAQENERGDDQFEETLVD